MNCVKQRTPRSGRKIRGAQEKRHSVQAFCFCSRKGQKLKQKAGKQRGKEWLRTGFQPNLVDSSYFS